ncbi:MAG TPA: hypothetical protein PLX49_09660 [Prolixibacteraceae bacterium]|nr:hypothetical protein [Prolixibacteraceae bacterium]
MKRILTSGTMVLLFLLPALCVSGQNTLKLRLSGTSTRFMSEPQGSEIDHPDLATMMSGATNTATQITQFTHKGNMGFEAELMMSLTDKVYFGLEVGQDYMSGYNDNPGFYNFQLTDQLELLQTLNVNDIPTIRYTLTQAPLKYNTNLLNFIGNMRIFPAPDGRFRPFIKVSAGMALVSTELSLKMPPELEETQNGTSTDIPLVLFSRGTKDAPKGREAALVVGAGLGFELQVTDRIALYADGSYRLVNSSILDGKPNFDWKENPEWTPENPDYDPNYVWDFVSPDPRGKLEEFTTRTNIGKLTFGIVYTLGNNLSVTGGGSKGRQIGGGSSKSLPYLPFFKLKRL